MYITLVDNDREVTLDVGDVKMARVNTDILHGPVLVIATDVGMVKIPVVDTTIGEDAVYVLRS